MLLQTATLALLVAVAASARYQIADMKLARIEDSIVDVRSHEDIIDYVHSQVPKLLHIKNYTIVVLVLEYKESLITKGKQADGRLILGITNCPLDKQCRHDTTTIHAARVLMFHYEERLDNELKTKAYPHVHLYEPGQQPEPKVLIASTPKPPKPTRLHRHKPSTTKKPVRGPSETSDFLDSYEA